MKAYVELIQRRERDIGCDVLTHQTVRALPSPRALSTRRLAEADVLPPLRVLQWSGAEFVDDLLMTVTGGVSSTAAMGKGVTEHQFTKPAVATKL